MSLVFKTPLNAKNTTTRGSQNIDSPSGCTLVEGSAEYTENGEYTLAPEEADGFSSVSITVDVPSDVNNQEKSATPTTSSQEVTPDSGYTGLSKVTVSAVTAAIDANITAGNIKKDVEILGVTGNYDPHPDLEAKTVNSSTVQQVITPTAGKDGLSSVTVEPYTLQAKSATPTTSQQVIEPDNDKDGLSSVTVAAVTSAIDANIAAGNIKEGVTILGVQGTVHEGITPTGNINITDTTSTDVTNYATAQVVDANLAAGNIKDGVTILGVTGSYDPQPNLDTLNVTPSTSAQTLTPTSPVDGFDEVVVSAVTSSIDANIAAGNIKDGVTILGVTGTYTGGGSACVDWSSMGWSCQDVVDSGITPDVAYTASVKDNNSWANDTQLVFAPKTSNYRSGGIFYGCSELKFVPDFTFTSQEAPLFEMFRECVELEGVGIITCPNKTQNNYANYAFYNCKRLKEVKSIDMNHSTEASYMFQNCEKLTSVSFTNDGSVTNTGSMFSGCSSLTSIPTFDYSHTTAAGLMFYNCTGLTTVNLSLPAANDSTDSWRLFQGCTGITSATLSAPLQPRWGYTFEGCTSLQTATITMGSNVIEADRMFRNCTSLTTVTNFDASGLQGTWNMFEGCSALTTLGGFTGLGTAYTGTSNHNLNLSASSVLTKASIMNVINELGTATAGTNATLTLSATSYALLDASDIAIATAKNWSVVSA